MSEFHYNTGYGHCPLSGWGVGPDVSPYAEGDIVEIPSDSPAFTDGRIPHGWSQHPELWEGAKRYRVVSAFSIGDGPEWYFRVAPIQGRRTIWSEHSDRLHVIPGMCDYTAGWKLIGRAVRATAAG